MEKPDVDYIEGLSPAISIDQKTTSQVPFHRGTIYEILRSPASLCQGRHTPLPQVRPEDPPTVRGSDGGSIMKLPQRSRIQLLAPLIRGKKGQHVKLLDGIRREGYVRVRIDGEMRELSEEIVLDRNRKHTIEVVVDRLIIRDDIQKRLADSLETVLALGGGLAIVDVIDGDEYLYSQNYACPDCDISMEELDPRIFSFNTPYGACEKCNGLGTLMEIDPDLVLPNRELSLLEGALTAPGWNMSNGDSVANMYMKALAKRYGFRLDTPVKDMEPDHINRILYGTDGKLKISYNRGQSSGSFTAAFEGIIPNLEQVPGNQFSVLKG